MIDQKEFEKSLDDYFSEWDICLDEKLSLRQNVLENLKALVLVVVENAECGIAARRASEAKPEKGSGRGEVGDLVVTVWPLGLDAGWVLLTRAEDIEEPDPDDEDEE